MNFLNKTIADASGDNTSKAYYLLPVAIKIMKEKGITKPADIKALLEKVADDAGENTFSKYQTLDITVLGK